MEMYRKKGGVIIGRRLRFMEMYRQKGGVIIGRCLRFIRREASLLVGGYVSWRCIARREASLLVGVYVSWRCIARREASLLVGVHVPWRCIERREVSLLVGVYVSWRCIARRKASLLAGVYVLLLFVVLFFSSPFSLLNCNWWIHIPTLHCYCDQWVCTYDYRQSVKNLGWHRIRIYSPRQRWYNWNNCTSASYDSALTVQHYWTCILWRYAYNFF